MATPTQIATQIRFALDTLGENNDHHAFERVCLGLTRRRIVSNLLPATGPVSAGGDQGRDAETHWTNLPAEGVTSWFSALASEDGVSLACTLQKADIPRKISSDLAAIMSTGSDVRRVIYFTIMPVAVGQRHLLQSDAREAHQVELDIWDAQAISQALADHDLFYLAVDHLHVATELASERPVDAPGLPDWYVEELAEWRARTSFRGSTGEVVALRESLRYSSTHTESHADLADWLSIAYELRAAIDATETRRRLDYEIVLATAFGQNTLRSADVVITEYFSELLSSRPIPAVLVEAITLLRLATAMLYRGDTTLSREAVRNWYQNLDEWIDFSLAAPAGPNARAQLLVAQALLALSPAIADAESPPENLLSMTEVVETLREDRFSGSHTIEVPADGQLVDPAKGMTALASLATVLPTTPLVPIDDLTTNFDLHTPILSQHPDYLAIRDALDEATGRVEGQAAKGDRAQTRAITLLKAGNPRAALREIHEAKFNWLTGDTADGAALMMLLASRVYYDLRLPMAAKQYAMAAASVARQSGDPELAVLMARGILVAATCDHLAGQSLTATYCFRVGIWAQAQLADDPWSLSRYPAFQNMLIDQAHIMRAASGARPEALAILEPVIGSTQLDQLLGSMLASVASLLPMTETELAAATDRDGIGRPFSDAGPTRTYEWIVLNNLWRVKVRNERAAVLAAERFIAAAQVLLVDEDATRELLILPGLIEVRVEVGEDASFDIEDGFEDLTDVEPGHFALTLTPVGRLTPERAELETNAALLRVLFTLSLLPREPFMQIVEEAFEHGLWHKLNAIRPYDELADLHKDEMYETLSAVSFDAVGADSPRTSDPRELVEADPWTSRSYDETAALHAIEAAYSNLRRPVRLTLQRLRQEGSFAGVLAALGEQGWKDWHALTAVANIVVNDRARHRGLNMTTTMSVADRDRFVDIMSSDESATDPEPSAGLFTLENMQFHLRPAATSSLHRFDLELHAGRTDPEQVLLLLGARFRYWADDVPHDTVFD